MEPNYIYEFSNSLNFIVKRSNRAKKQGQENLKIATNN